MELLKEVIKEIKPGEKEKKEINDKINRFISKIKIPDAKAILGGSGAKQTWLSGQFDADIFTLFDYKKYKNKDITKILNRGLKRKFKKVTTLPGSRAYYRIYEKDFLFEIIPILKITKAEQARNITDVSPLHARFVKKHTNEKLRDEIRLLKQFCRAQGCYGAESYIRGFSGYVCELLIVYYNSFLNLLKSSIKWKKGKIIDILNHYKNKNIFMEINKSKLQSPLIVIDPVQKDRNAAAALSDEKFDIFKNKAKEFLKSPSREFFIKKEITIGEIKNKAKHNHLIILNIKPTTGKEDIVGSKLLKAFNYINKKLIDNEFNIVNSGWLWDKKQKAVFWYILKKEKLSDYIIINGPPVNLKMHVKNFKKKYKKTFVKNNKIYSKIKRKFKEPKKLVKVLVMDRYIREKVKEWGSSTV